MNTSQQITVSQDELQQLLEPLIRRVIREELLRIIQRQPDIFFSIQICRSMQIWKRLLNGKPLRGLNCSHTKRSGMGDYQGVYEKRFVKNLARYAS